MSVRTSHHTGKPWVCTRACTLGQSWTRRLLCNLWWLFTTSRMGCNFTVDHLTACFPCLVFLLFRDVAAFPDPSNSQKYDPSCQNYPLNRIVFTCFLFFCWHHSQIKASTDIFSLLHSNNTVDANAGSCSFRLSSSSWSHTNTGAYTSSHSAKRQMESRVRNAQIYRQTGGERCGGSWYEA